MNEIVVPPSAGPESDATSLVRLALEQGVGVDILERLVALQERVTARNARAAFFAALSRFQDACPEIPKTKTANITTKRGANFGYSYAPLDVMHRTIRPALRDNGLSFSWDVKLEGRLMHVRAILRHVDGHSEESTFPVPIDNDAAMSDAQKNGAALTYGRRQSLLAVLGLSTADTDIDGATGDVSDSAEVITESQAADLDALLEESGVDRVKFLKWLNVEQLADVKRGQYRLAVDALEKRRKE